MSSPVSATSAQSDVWHIAGSYLVCTEWMSVEDEGQTDKQRCLDPVTNDSWEAPSAVCSQSPYPLLFHLPDGPGMLDRVLSLSWSFKYQFKI